MIRNIQEVISSTIIYRAALTSTYKVNYFFLRPRSSLCDSFRSSSRARWRMGKSPYDEVHIRKFEWKARRAPFRSSIS